jgi:hypothetical protein
MASPEAQAIEQSWQAVGGYLTEAILETAESIGDPELIERVAKTAASADVLPDPAALLLLESVQAGAAELVITRAAEIQKQAHELELAGVNSFRHKAKALGRGLLWLR